LFGPKLKQKKSDTWVQYMKERYQKLKDIQQKYPGKKEDPELIELEKMIHQL